MMMNVFSTSQNLPRKVVMVGAGRVASHLAPALHAHGVVFVQVYSRTLSIANQLAQRIGAEAVDSIDAICMDADCYLVSLTDEALLQLTPQLTKGREEALWVHTAGSVPMQLFAGHAHQFGVLYPMQTFSKGVAVDFTQVSLFVEASSPVALQQLKQLASLLTTHIHEADSQQRKSLHVAAVISCNFVNHCYALAQRWLEQQGLPFEAMLPLIDETARKVHQLKPTEAQTGPAIRGDQQVIQSHLKLLASSPQLQQLYRILSESIASLREE